MLHDETVYPDPFSFKPERFLKSGKINKEVRDPIHMAFGYGRRSVINKQYPPKKKKRNQILYYRLCPGRHLAVSAVWITIASLIAAFDITKAIDENGNVIEA